MIEWLTWRTTLRGLFTALCLVATVEVHRLQSSTSTSIDHTQLKLRRNSTTYKFDEPDAVRIHSNINRVRPRPTNLHLVFVGDSLTRYTYLSLAYFLKHGEWLDPSSPMGNLVNSHSFHHPLHPNQDWNEFFWQSSRALAPYEACDCYRDEFVSLERRYFRVHRRNNTLVFINLNGNEPTSKNRGYYGHWKARDVFSHFDRYVNRTARKFPSLECRTEPRSEPWDREVLQDGCVERNENADTTAWEYSSWADVIRLHVAELGIPKDDTAVLLNAGLHSHSLSELREAAGVLKDLGLRGLWKTTTFTLSQVRDDIDTRERETDRVMCRQLECFNLSWTEKLLPELYFDELHFVEPVYRLLNEDLLERVGSLPSGYERLDRKVVLKL